MTPTFDARRYVSDFVTSMNSKDPETYLRHFAENAEVKDPSTPAPVRGKGSLLENWQMWSRAFGEVDFGVKDVVGSENKFAIMSEARARHMGELELSPGETIPATNKSVHFDVAEFVTVGPDGKITKSVTIFDMAQMMMQLGLMPNPAEMKGRAAPGQGQKAPRR